ncbi:hypothetical protein FIU85_19605 [Roseovarius sp. THAF8]|uniref:hypothetical protein n=1 Tax=Roseovarius sp. THAF8 TaxID=2587846 RepID=UPI00126896AC|nr:hypothetical protein [Roseovarius sp. THAF8]QFT99531.1 hypothetical protein FIU85_19605 [Roseovarius sp. THAF8]
MDDQVYPGGFASLVRRFESKRTQFTNWQDLLPPVDADLSPYFQATVSPGPVPPRRKTRDIYEKHEDFSAQLAGYSEAHVLNAILIAVLRRRDPPDEALSLFFRLWSEHGARLVKDMPVRWMVSSATTFADHGRTGDQRACGMGLAVLFDTIKLYESERSYSGLSGRKLFSLRPGEKRHSMPFAVTRYSFKSGDLDKNMLARLWLLSEADATIAPLARAMLRLVVSDTRTVFSRVQRMKAARAERRARKQP